MIITAYFSEDGLPKTGLSPTLDIIDLADNSVTVNDGNMSEVGQGYYKYTFSNDNTKDYAIICDSVTLTDSERYAITTTEAKGDVGEIKTQTDKMNFTGDDIKATLDSEEVTTDSASRTASKADVTNLDVAVSTRNNITPPTTGEIKTELEGAGTKLTLIKDKTDTLDWTDITKILQIEQGRWKIVNNQMIFYDSDNTTPLFTFNLKDSSGQATETSVFERTPA